MHKKGILENSVGMGGGFSLEPAAREISIYDVFLIMEKTVMLNRCLEEDCYCSGDAEEDCPVKEVYAGIQQTLENSLKSVKLKNLI